MKPEQLFEKIADKHKIPEGDVKEVFEAKLEECKDADLKGDQAKERAMKRTWGAFKRKDMSNSTGVEGVVLGVGDRYDAVGRSRENAIDAYKENPQGAIKSGKVAVAVPPGDESNLAGTGVEVVGEKNGWKIVARPDNDNILGYDFAERSSAESDDANTQVEDGWRVYPLDTRETYGNGDPNPRYGTPTPKHQWKRRGIGVFTTGDEVKVGQLTLTGKKSLQAPPLGEAVQFKGRVNEGDDGTLYINSTNETEFQANPELDDDLPSVDSLIEKYMGDEYLHDLDGLYSYMESQNGARTVVATGDVIDMNLEATSNDTFRMVLGQLSFEGGEMVEREVTVWVPAFLEDYIDFAVESRVYIVGRARMQDAYNGEDGEKEVVLNAQGLYADPTSKVPREETDEVEEEDFDFDAEDDGEDEEMEAEFEGGDAW